MTVLGSKQLYSGIVGLVDVARVMIAFEEANDCAMTVTMTPVMRGHGTDLLIKVTAFTKQDVYVEPVALASVELYRSAGNFLTMESVIISALYQLDARMEYGSGQKEVPK